MDWSYELEQVHNHLQTLDRTTRQHAQHISLQDQQMVELNNRMNDLSQKLEKTVSFATSTNSNFEEACGNIVTRYALKTEIEKFDDHFNIVAKKMSEFELMLNNLKAQQYNIHTPHGAREEPGPSKPEDVPAGANEEDDDWENAG